MDNGEPKMTQELLEFLESLELTILHNVLENIVEYCIGNIADPSVGIWQFCASPWFRSMGDLAKWVILHRVELERWANGEITEIDP